MSGKSGAVILRIYNAQLPVVPPPLKLRHPILAVVEEWSDETYSACLPIARSASSALASSAARSLAGLPEANSSELDPATPDPVIATMAEQVGIVDGAVAVDVTELDQIEEVERQAIFGLP